MNSMCLLLVDVSYCSTDVDYVAFSVDKIVKATVAQPSVVVENVTATFSVSLDASQNQSYGSIQYTWHPGDGTKPQYVDHPVFTHKYARARVYPATVVISNFLPNVDPLRVPYQVDVASGEYDVRVLSECQQC